MSSSENAARLRADIDSGRTGDKVPAADPTAAPLGTYEEAAGASPAPETIAQVRQQEPRGRTSRGRIAVSAMLGSK